MVTLMWYAAAAVVVLVLLVVSGRLLVRRRAAQAFPSAQLLAPEPPPSVTLVVEPMKPITQSLTQSIEQQRLRPAPGAPNTDSPTDRHITERGTATIHKRTGRRRSTTNE